MEKLPSLDQVDAAGHPGSEDKEAARQALVKHREQLAELHDLLYANRRHALLIILQGMDTSGKDGTIRHVLSGLNPVGTQVLSFKAPNDLERAHDYLWRIHRHVPPHGTIGVFNRSHYEDVVTAFVHGTIDEAVRRRRFDEINAFEQYLHHNGIILLKFFLHISPEEQAERLAARIRDPAKMWKLSASDLSERPHWNEYQAAYNTALQATHTAWAPWTIVPADHKWYRNLLVARTVVAALEALKLGWPTGPVS
ncbi:MAG: PPK2 family polyphosphate kinase [Pseudomonadota bacterium]|uniref:PPK2 family polyphosphate kinase n=1 Tax=Thermithiobacillus tepidarius TaxID=929 RepID=UPI000405D6AB|nr:PPK2 family polyphosphate kinase [Thermithiobacillus tepidarius]